MSIVSPNCFTAETISFKTYYLCAFQNSFSDRHFRGAYQDDEGGDDARLDDRQKNAETIPRGQLEYQHFRSANGGELGQSFASRELLRRGERTGGGIYCSDQIPIPPWPWWTIL